MSFIRKSLVISALFLLQLPAFAAIQETELSGTNPLDRKTEFINNHLIAVSSIKTPSGVKKFIAAIPAIGSKKIIIYEANPATDKLIESATFTDQLYAPMYLIFDPSGLHLYAVSSTRNFVAQYSYDQASNKFVTGHSFQTACDDNNRFGFDYSRTLQFFPAEDKAYVTCQDKNNQFMVDRYNYNAKTGALTDPDALLRNKNSGQKKGDVVGEVANSSAVLIDPSGDYLYSVDRKNIGHEWRQHDLTENGKFEPTPYSFRTAELSVRSMVFDPSGKNAYVIAFDRGGNSVIVQYIFDQASGNLIRSNTVNIVNEKDHPRARASYILFAPKGNYAYVIDNDSNLIYQYRVDTKTGKLSALEPASLITCSVIRSLTFDPDSSKQRLYAMSSPRSVITPKNPKECQQSWISSPFDRYIVRLSMDPLTGQLSNK